MRQRIYKQINKGKSIYRPVHAARHGHSQELHAATRSGQLVAEVCEYLLMNVIVCCDNLHLA